MDGKHFNITVVFFIQDKRTPAESHNAAFFRSACSPWRAAVPFTTFGPLLLLPFDPDSDHVGFYCVPEKKVLSKTLPDVHDKVACGSWCGWMALMDEAASVTLLNPFAGARAPRVELPPAGKAIKLEDIRDVFFHEIVLSVPPDVVGRECVAMDMLGCSTEVAFYRVGVDSAWTLLGTKLEFFVGSIVHCQDMFLAIDCTGEISIYSSNAIGATLTATLLPSLSPHAGLCHRNYLESNGELHIVGAMVSTFHKTQSFTYSSTIYKCNIHDLMPEWSRVRDIGDQTLFVSKHFNESFSATSVSKYKENKIYMSKSLYGDPYDLVHRLKIVDIATGASEVKPV
ncbi:uncharacterized protein [Miscanthus floridulus]|uniref:uncharacterized protein n=1 Tax=Miscanthus floridulus TaxID=154761 RepID=UPI00345B2E15